MQHLPAPKCRRRHYGETSSGEPSPRPHFPRLSSSCAILSRKWGEGAGVSGDAPPHFSPVRRAVTQPRWPRLTEPGRPRQTDAHLGPAAFLGPPSCMLHTRPFPVPSLPVRSRPAPASPGQPWLSIVTVGTGGNSLQPWSPRSTPTLPTTPEFCQPGFGQIQSKRRRGGDATFDVSAEVARGVLRKAAFQAAVHLPRCRSKIRGVSEHPPQRLSCLPSRGIAA